jgi:hypothetical protein
MTQWWRLGGILGIGFIILFVVGIIIIQGEGVSFDDPMEKIRSYWVDDGNQYLIGDYIGGLGFVFFFLPFLVILRGLLAWVEGGPNVWSWVTFAAGFLSIMIGAAASASWGALAMGAAEHPDVDDSSIRSLMYVDAYAFSALGYGLALMVLAASIVIYRTGVLWRWLAPLGLIVAAGLVLSPLYVIDAQQDEGFFGIVGFIGFIGVMIWVLIVSVGMIMKRELPARAID